jgi:putative DNA methylase
MCEEAENRVSHLFPKFKMRDGNEFPVVAWLWSHTVASPNPA